MRQRYRGLIFWCLPLILLLVLFLNLDRPRKATVPKSPSKREFPFAKKAAGEWQKIVVQDEFHAWKLKSEPGTVLAFSRKRIDPNLRKKTVRADYHVQQVHEARAFLFKQLGVKNWKEISNTGKWDGTRKVFRFSSVIQVNRPRIGNQKVLQWQESDGKQVWAWTMVHAVTSRAPASAREKWLKYLSGYPVKDFSR